MRWKTVKNNGCVPLNDWDDQLTEQDFKMSIYKGL